MVHLCVDLKTLGALLYNIPIICGGKKAKKCCCFYCCLPHTDEWDQQRTWSRAQWKKKVFFLLINHSISLLMSGMLRPAFLHIGDARASVQRLLFRPRLSVVQAVINRQASRFTPKKLRTLMRDICIPFVVFISTVSTPVYEKLN